MCDFAISQYSDLPLFCNELKSDISIINLKNEKNVDEISKKYDIIFSLHCKQIFPKSLVTKKKCINIQKYYCDMKRVLPNQAPQAMLKQINGDIYQ